MPSPLKFLIERYAVCEGYGGLSRKRASYLTTLPVISRRVMHVPNPKLVVAPAVVTVAVPLPYSGFLGLRAPIVRPLQIIGGGFTTLYTSILGLPAVEPVPPP